MLPLKWKIFRIVSYLHMTSTIIVGASMLYFMLSEVSISASSTEDAIGLIILILTTTALLANSSVNMYLLERFYPDKQPGKQLGNFSRVLFILCIPISLFVLGTAGLLLNELISQKHTDLSQNLPGYAATIVMTIIGVTGFYILWIQVSLRKAIRRNYEASINKFLESDQP